MTKFYVDVPLAVLETSERGREYTLAVASRQARSINASSCLSGVDSVFAQIFDLIAEDKNPTLAGEPNQTGQRNQSLVVQALVKGTVY